MRIPKEVISIALEAVKMIIDAVNGKKDEKAAKQKS